MIERAGRGEEIVLARNGKPRARLVPLDADRSLRVPGKGKGPISVRHADAVRRLAPHHRDPFDRLLIAQAQAEDLAIVTRDPVCKLYDVAVRW